MHAKAPNKQEKLQNKGGGGKQHTLKIHKEKSC